MPPVAYSAGMVRAWLLLNAVLYLVLGAWCALDPATTSRFVGLERTGPAGHTEWMAVYGGLELGLGAFFARAALRPALQPAGLLFGLCLYGGIVLLRSVAAVQVSLADDLFALGPALGMWMLEVLLLGSGLLAWRRLPARDTP